MSLQPTHPDDPDPLPPVQLVNAATGVGKSAEIYKLTLLLLEHLRGAHDRRPIVIAVPRHDLSEEARNRLLAEPLARTLGVTAIVLRGRERDDPLAPGETMCRRLQVVREASRSRIRPSALCRQKPKGEPEVRCPLFDLCGYQRQLKTADVYFVAHQALFSKPLTIVSDPAVLFVDESPLTAALWGVEGQPLDLPLDEIRAPVKLGQSSDTDRLNSARQCLMGALDGLEPGPLGRDPLIRAEVTSDLCKLAVRLEFERLVDAKALAVRPDMADNAALAALERGHSNADVHARVRVWRALEELLRGEVEDSGRIELVQDSQGLRSLRTRGLHQVAEGWRVLTLVADATADAELLRYLWPQIKAVPRIPVAMPHVKVRQVVDRTLSKAAIAPEMESQVSDDPKRQGRRVKALTNVRRLKAALIKSALTYGGQKVLAIMPKATREAMEALGLPPWLKVAHHGAITGLDSYGDASAVYVIGRPLARGDVVGRMAGALTGKYVGGEYIKATALILTADQGEQAGAIEVQAWQHSDSVADRLRWQITEGSLLQAIGRGRGVNRTASNPLDVHLWTDIALPELGPVRPLTWDELSADRDDEMLAAGCWLENAPDAARAWPELIASAAALKMARSRRGQMVTPASRISPLSKRYHLVPVRYRRAVERSGACQAVFLAGLIPDHRAWLEGRLGPLAVFEVIEPPAPRSEASAESSGDVLEGPPPPNDSLGPANGATAAPAASERVARVSDVQLLALAGLRVDATVLSPARVLHPKASLA